MEAEPRITFGKWLKQRRKALDLTQRELAEKIGCAVITIQKLEADQRRPSKPFAELLAKHLLIEDADYGDFVGFARARQHTIPSFLHEITNIPVLTAPLIRREPDITAIRARILGENQRLVTLLGPPGVGKTSLAVQVANELLNSFANGVYFIPLDVITDHRLVPAAIAQALGINHIGTSTITQRVKEYLREKEMLLVIDNFEHVLEAAAFIAELSSMCPWLCILVTSRSPLSIRGEHRYLLSPLDLPKMIPPEVDPAELIQYSAIRLFVERARAINSDFMLDLSNCEDVAALCVLLDGLPLAIELVSVRTDFLTPKELFEQIKAKDPLHVGELRDGSERHRTLHHAILWSYALLTPEQQQLLACLSVFVGGWTLEAAEKIIGGCHAINITASLMSLVDANLVLKRKQGNQQRFFMLETIRSFASARLVEAGDAAILCRHHADYYMSLSEMAEPRLRSAEQDAWLERMEVERGNFRAALSWFLENPSFYDSGLRLAVALGWFWNMRSYVSEGHYWLSRALKYAGDGSSAARAKALTWLGSITYNEADLPDARAYFEEGIAIYRSLGAPSQWNLALALSAYCNVVMYMGDCDALRHASNESYELFNRLKDPWGSGLALCLIGEVHLMNHDYARACACYEEAARILRVSGDRWAIGIALMDWGYTNSLMGELTEARSHLEESVALHRSLGERFIRSMSLSILAQVVQQQEDAEKAILLYEESLDLLRKMGIEQRITSVQYNLASFVHSQGHYPLAKTLYQECLKMFIQQGNREGIMACEANLRALA